MSNKEKLMLSAQKYLQKGRVDKAIKDYEKIIKLDSNDIRCRLKVAELYSRSGEASKAIAEYEFIAKHYCNNKFFLKAIAVFKQIQKLAPERKDLYRQLGDLNEQEGLTGNAIAEYRRLCDHLEKEGKYSELVPILKKLALLEPHNLPLRMKYAEAAVKYGSEQEARLELESISEIVKGQDSSSQLKFFEFYKSLFPGDFEVDLGLAQAQIRSGKGKEGVSLLERMASKGTSDHRVFELLAEGYSLVGNSVGIRKALGVLLPLKPDDLELRLKYVRACVESRNMNRALDALAPWKEKFLERGMGSTIRGFYEVLKKNLPNDSRVDEGLKTITEFTNREENPFDSAALNEMGVPVEKSPADETAVPPIEKSVPGGIEDSKVFSEAGVEKFLNFDDLAANGEEKGAAAESSSFDAEKTQKNEENHDIISEEEKIAEGQLDQEKSEAEGFLDLDFLSDMDEKVAESRTPDFFKELEECDFYFQQGLLDEAEKICHNILTMQSDCRAAQERLDQISIRRAALAAESTKKKKLGQEARGGKGLFDSSGDAWAGDGEFDLALDEVLADSQKGIKTEIGQEDTETHFQLGIAFKEMGQLDEALKEFDQAMKDPNRFVACAILKASCLIDKGVFDAAEEYFLGVLSRKGLSEQDILILNFELGLFYQEQNRLSEAMERFRNVSNIDPFYREVGEKISELEMLLENDNSSGAEKDEGGTPNGRKDRVSYI